MRNDFDFIRQLGRTSAKEGPDDRIVLGSGTLERIITPTHVIRGFDDMFGGRDVGEWIVEVMPNASVEFIAGSGHLPWLDDPAGVARSTVDLLGGSGTRDRANARTTAADLSDASTRRRRDRQQAFKSHITTTDATLCSALRPPTCEDPDEPWKQPVVGADDRDRRTRRRGFGRVGSGRG
jgi:hypothetical protein